MNNHPFIALLVICADVGLSYIYGRIDGAQAERKRQEKIAAHPPTPPTKITAIADCTACHHPIAKYAACPHGRDGVGSCPSFRRL